MDVMQKQIRRFGRLAAFVACAVTGVASVPSESAATQPATPRAVHAAAPLKHGRRLGAHHVFGTILAIDGSMLSLQRRNGKLLTVDATSVIANDDYSYPLFVGKTVAIDGTFSNKTTFVATHINAITSLQSLEADK